MIRSILAIALATGLSACGGSGVAVETVYKPVNVPVRAKCPDDATYAKVQAAKPVPLRDQERPATEEATRQAERAQIGRYEAADAFVDQVMTVIDRCHDAPELGLASPP